MDKLPGQIEGPHNQSSKFITRLDMPVLEVDALTEDVFQDAFMKIYTLEDGTEILIQPDIHDGKIVGIGLYLGAMDPIYLGCGYIKKDGNLMPYEKGIIYPPMRRLKSVYEPSYELTVDGVCYERLNFSHMTHSQIPDFIEGIISLYNSTDGYSKIQALLQSMNILNDKIFELSNKGCSITPAQIISCECMMKPNKDIDALYEENPISQLTNGGMRIDSATKRAHIFENYLSNL